MARRNHAVPPDGPLFRMGERRSDDGTLTLSLHGDLDIGTAPEFAQRMRAAVAPGAELVLDFNALDFMDSSGLAVLLATIRHAHTQGCHIALVRPQEGLLRLFRVAGVESLLPVAPGPGESAPRGWLRPGRRVPPRLPDR